MNNLNPIDKEELGAIMEGAISINEAVEPKLHDLFVVELPTAYSPNVFVEEHNEGKITLRAEIGNDRQEFQSEGAIEVMPKGFKTWLKEEKNLSEKEIDRVLDSGEWRNYIHDYATHVEKGYEELVYPDAVEQEKKYIDAMRNIYGFAGGRTGGPFPEHSHYDWEKEIEINKEKFTEKARNSKKEEFAKWVVEQVLEQ